MPGYERAGVLVPVVLDEEQPNLLFTLRTEHVDTHKGQVSFPGGAVHLQDTSIIETALRETHEELGIPPRAVETFGLLDDLATPSGFIITPVVGVLRSMPPLRPNPAEVADTFTVPLLFFTDPSNSRSELREFKAQQHEVWFYETQPHTIWGVTALIVRSFLKKLGLL